MIWPSEFFLTWTLVQASRVIIWGIVSGRALLGVWCWLDRDSVAYLNLFAVSLSYILTFILSFEVHILLLSQTFNNSYPSVLETVFGVTYIYNNVIIKCFLCFKKIKFDIYLRATTLIGWCFLCYSNWLVVTWL